MEAERAKGEFKRLHALLVPECPLPMNKQKGDKRSPAYLTGLVNMLIEAHCRGYLCD